MQNGLKTMTSTHRPKIGEAICYPLEAVAIEWRPP